MRCALPLWALLAQHSFYAFGHHATFSSIPWEAAFIGLPGNFRFQSIQALPVILNLNAGHIFLVVFLPLTVIWPLYSHKMGPLALHDRGDGREYDDKREENLVFFQFWSIAVQFMSLLAGKVSPVPA